MKSSSTVSWYHSIHAQIINLVYLCLYLLFVIFLPTHFLLSMTLINSTVSCIELMVADRHQKREIRQLEQELPRWQVLVDSITGQLQISSSVNPQNTSNMPNCVVTSYNLWNSCRCLLLSLLHVLNYVLNLYAGMNSPEFDNQTLAALRGRMVRYLMRSREVRFFFPPLSFYSCAVQFVFLFSLTWPIFICFPLWI